MSRSFDNNDRYNFYRYLQHNFNRKMAVLKLLHGKDNKLYFDNSGIMTHKLSCIQYLLVKYGLTKDDWKRHGINSNWLGFEKIEDLLHNMDGNVDCFQDNIESLGTSSLDIIKCLLYPVVKRENKDLLSIKQYQFFYTDK